MDCPFRCSSGPDPEGSQGPHRVVRQVLLITNSSPSVSHYESTLATAYIHAIKQYNEKSIYNNAAIVAYHKSAQLSRNE